jgi:hypothetical protein
MKMINMKKIVLCLMFSSPTFALQSIGDAELSNIDGRAGITIESQLHDTSTIGSISYTDGDGDGQGHTDSAGIYLSGISIGASSAKSKIDVFSDGVLNIEISDIFQGDIWVRNIAMGDTDTSFGAVGITNFNYDAAGTYNVKFAATDPKGNGFDLAALIFDFNMASSSFDFTFVDEAEFSLVGERELINGNTISYSTQFSDFKAEETTVYADDTLSPDGRSWMRVDLGSISGSVRLEDVSFGSVVDGVVGLTEVFGSAGFSNINIDTTSFVAFSGHENGSVDGGGIDIKVAAELNIENFYIETKGALANIGNRANFGNIAIDTDASGNDPFDITLDAVNSGFRKGLVLAIDNVNEMNLTIRDLYVSKFNRDTNTVSDEAVFGTIGIEKINFNGGIAELSFIGRAGSGNQGIETGFSLPDGTTLDFTINDYEYAPGAVAGAERLKYEVGDIVDGNALIVGDALVGKVKGGELRASIEINDFSAESVIDVVALGKDNNNVDQGTGMRVTFKSMEGAFDIRNFSAGNGTTYKGSYGRIQVDGMNLKRGYLIVDAL